MKKLSFLTGGAFSAFAAVSVCLLVSYRANAAYTTDLPASLVNLTGSGTASTTGNIYANEGPATAFDHNTAGTRVIWKQKTDVDLVYEFPEPTRVNAFRIWRTAQYERHPQTFSFQGWNGTDWQTLDGDTGLNKDTDWKPVSYRYYRFTNCISYTKYRLFINENCGNQYTEFYELELFDDKTPVIASHSIKVNSATSFDVSVTMGDNAVDDVVVKAIDSSGTVAASANLGPLAANGSAVGNLQNLAADATYQVRVDTASGSFADENPVDTIYTGALALSDVVSAQEEGRVPGSVTVSRAAADDYPLVINYAFSSSDATPGVTYVVPSGQVVIPAGSASATIEVAPLVDLNVSVDTTVTVSLTAGNYALSGSESANVTIVNAAIPSDKNVWVAGDSSDGLASTAANWSKGVPSASNPESLVIFVSGDFSTHDLVWDATAANGLATTVTSWTQTDRYSKTVEFETTYADGAFPLFSITGDCSVNGGTWTHHTNTNVANNAAAEYRLNVAVGGNFTLGAGAKIDVIGRGYNVGRCPAGSQVGVHAATARGTYSAIYGNVLAPEDVGSGGESGGQYGPNISSGGGAVKLVVTGSAVVDGTIAANAQKQYISGNPEKGHGAGGSVFITASSISGSGTVDVSARPAGVSETAYTGYAGSGGRMALVATSGDVTIPMDKLLADGSWGSYSAGAGTIYIKNANDTNGSLLVGTSAASWSFSVRYVRKDGCTCVKPGETWTFDHIYVRDRGILSVPEGATLSLPGGFESVSSLTDSTTPLCGILYLGGTISLPVRQEHVLSGPWMFMAAEPFTFQGDVRLTSKASIGSFQLYADSVAAYPACTVRVTGDMTVESGATLYANNRGRRGADAKSQGYHGGSVAVTTHHLNVYDSIFSPNLGGTGGRSDDMGKTCPGGGAIVLTVVGQLTMNGNANAGSTDISANSHLGAAGTINITAGSLVGSGNITANGGSSSSAKSRGAGGGGRVSVRLTDAGATFAGFTGTIKAEGNNGNTSTTTAGSSAGTVYLQDGNTAEGAGIIKVANIANSTAVDAKTGFPSLANNAPIDDLTKATLEVSNNSKVIFIADVKMGGLELASGSSIDLAGKKVVVKRAKLAGTSLAPGTYAAGDAAVSGFVTDSDAGGELVVSGVGFTLVVR